MARYPRNKMRQMTKNPHNPQSTLYKKLTRLLSGPIINYRHQQLRKARRVKLDKYSKTFKTASGQQFKKKTYNPYDNLMANLMVNQARAERYIDFDQMEYTPELASALDIYADEITTHSEFGQLLKIDCSNEEIKVILQTLFYQVLNIEFNLFGWARTLIKYGDFFLYLDVDDELGIKSAIGLPGQEVERMEGEDPTNPNYIQYQWNSGGMTFENWQIAHFRVLANDRYSPYGTSVLESARRIWRQLTLLEDAMMAHRIVRAPDRRVYYVDVGGIPPEDVEQFMQKAMTQLKRHSVVDPSTGHVDLRYNPASVEEDFWIPVRGGQSGTKIEQLAGQTGNYTIDDVKYLRDKLFAAIKIPMSYLIRGEGGEEDKTTLAQKDIRFARTIQRLQRSVVSELEKIAIVHLYILGYRGEDLISFKLNLHNPSKIAAMQDLEQWGLKITQAEAAAANFFSKRWISKNLLGISEEEFVRNQRERFYDKKLEATMAKIAEVAGEAAGMAEMGALGGDMAGLGGDMGDMGGDMADLGGDAAGPAADLGGDMGGDMAAAPDAEAGGGFEGLLAAPAEAGAPAPAKRDEDYPKYDWVKVKRESPLGDVETTTSKSKGKWYNPELVDKRPAGARKRHHSAQAGRRQGGKKRNYPGYHDFKALSRGTISEEKSNYNTKVEQSLFRTSSEVHRLLESLEKKGNEDETQ